MLYGNLIFIKKTGGDGSKFPVTEKNIKIGRSEACLIRIYNPQVAPEHCQLIIKENGQATLRNLSNQTILNGKSLGHGDVTLCHGDVFKLGERMARWEYLPTSKYYKQVLSPTGRLVAVVIPQQRSVGRQAIPSTSASQISVLENTLLGKRRYSEKATSENSSAVKIFKTSGSESIAKSRNLPKFLTGHRLKSTKLLFAGAKTRERKSLSAALSLKTPRGKVNGKSRKSTLPSWKVNIASSLEEKISGDNNFSLKSPKISVKSPKILVKTPFKNITESKSSQPSVAETSFKETESHEKTGKRKSVLKTPLKTVIEPSSQASEGLRMSSRSSSSSPDKLLPKSLSKVVMSTPKLKSPKHMRLVQSESKLNSKPTKQSPFLKGNKRMSLILEKLDSSTKNLATDEPLSDTPGKYYRKRKLEGVSETVKETVSSTNIPYQVSTDITTVQTRNSLKNTPVQGTPVKSVKSLKKSAVNKILKNPTEVITITPGGNENTRTLRSLQKSETPKIRLSKKNDFSLVETPTLINFDDFPSSKKPKFTPLKFKSPLSKDIVKRKSFLLGSREVSVLQSESVLSSAPLTPVQSLSSPRSRKSALKEVLTSNDTMNSSKTKTDTPRGVRKKLSPSSSAEIAAKKLKTSSPKKPDKNKKAALLVLGKANRKQLLPQKVKVLLKRKIVKKAIKQSTVFKDETSKKSEIKSKNGLRRNISKKSKAAKKVKSVKKNLSAKPVTVKSPKTESFEENFVGSKVSEMNSKLTPKVFQTSPRMPLKGKTTNATSSKSPKFLKENQKLESPISLISSKSMNQTLLPSSFGKSAESFLFNSTRRSSKRLSSKNDTGRPDFIELSPTALGLMPKNVEIFKTPKEKKRRSSGLVNSENVRTVSIIKSASTSKIGSRKSVRFSSKDVSFNSGFGTPNIADKTDFDFSSVQTPDLGLDLFISPLNQSDVKTESSDTKITFSPENHRSNSDLQTCVRKLLQSPKPKKSIEKILPEKNNCLSSKTSTPTSSAKVEKFSKTIRGNKSPKNDLTDVRGVKKLLQTPRVQKSPKNDLSDVRGVKKLLQTPRVQKSPKNDLSDVRGVKKLLQTPRVQKSPKNDLSDVRGVKKLLQTPRVQKSPKNDLSDVRGVKKLLQTPRVQKSPKNDLSDVRGVKKLLQTPRTRKSPKNDLTDLRGVKKLLQTPKQQRSPKNDLSDVRGVKKLLQTPRTQKSPKNDLTDVVGVKRLLSLRAQKSPKNRLSDLRGVRKLLGSPKPQKSPKNELTDLTGVKELFTSRAQKSPKNRLSDLRGVRKLLGSPKPQKSPKNELTDLTGVKELFTSRSQKSPKNNLLDISGNGRISESPEMKKVSRNSMPTASSDSLKSEENSNVTGVKQLFISKDEIRAPSRKQNKSFKSPKSHENVFRAIRGRRTTYSTPRGPKNDLSDVTGVRELFLRHKPPSDFNISVTGVAELFDLSKIEGSSKSKGYKFGKDSVFNAETKTLRSKKTLKSNDEKKETTATTGKEAFNGESEKRSTRSRKITVEADSEKEKSLKRRTSFRRIETSQGKKSPLPVKKTNTKGKKSEVTKKINSEEEDAGKGKSSRKRKLKSEITEISPPKLRRKLPVTEEPKPTSRTSKRNASSSKVKAVLDGSIETIVKKRPKVQEKIKSNKTSTRNSKVQTKTAIQTGSKKTQKVQSKRSQNISKKKVLGSEIKLSPRKTRSEKKETASKRVYKKAQSKAFEKTPVKGAARKKNMSPKAVRTTRRK